MSGDRETRAKEYTLQRGDSQTRADFLAGWDAAVMDGATNLDTADQLLRAVMDALGIRPDQDPVIEAQRIATALAAGATEAAATALEDYAAQLDREHAEGAARHRVAGIRCLDCGLRYEERDQYSCGDPGHGHDYDQAELDRAATITPEPTWDGDHARARATTIRNNHTRTEQETR